MTLQKDLDKRISQKLKLWIKDSLALYEMAELEEVEARRTVICELSCALAYTAAKWIDRRDHHSMLVTLSNSVKEARRMLKKAEGDAH